MLDLLTNLMGAILGVLLASAMEAAIDAHHLRYAGRRTPDRAAALLLGTGFFWMLFPLFPVMSRTPLAQKLTGFFETPASDILPALSMALVFFAVGWLLHSAGFSRDRRLPLLSTLVIPLQVFVVTRQPRLLEFAGAISGASAFALAGKTLTSQKGAYRSLVAWVFLAWIVVRGLAPFHFTAEAVAFSWLPFGGFLQMNWQTGVQLVAEKLFWYGTAGWLFHKAGLRRSYAAGLVAAVLLLIEIAQTHLPGHVAEITDPLLAVFAAFALAMAARNKRVISISDARHRKPASNP